MVASLWCLASIPLQLFARPVVEFGEVGFGIFNIPVAPNFFTAAMLGVVGGALAVRKRAALWFVIVVFQGGWLLVAALSTVLKAWHSRRVPDVRLETQVDIVIFVVEVSMALGLVIVLWRIRDLFPARLAPGSWRRASLELAAGLAFSATVGIVLTEAFLRSLHGQSRLLVWPVEIAFGFMPGPQAAIYNSTGHHWIAAIIGALSTLALLRAGAVLLRSARSAFHLDPDDELQVRQLLHEAGENDSLGYFATRRDKAVCFSPDRRAAVVYRVELGTSLASGDPIGHADAWAGAIDAWATEARRYGWILAALSASEQGAQAYRRIGMRVLAIGDEAVIDVNEFHLDGPTMRSVRQAVTRIRRTGYQLEVRRHGEIAVDEMAEISRCAEAWRGDEPERGFSMALGRLGDAADKRCVMVTARSADGTLSALQSFVPWGRGGLSLDLMRRRPTADNGVVEFMVCGLVDASRRMGLRRISLNFAMFRDVFSGRERLGAGPVTRATAAMLGVAGRWWQLESLYRSNQKYEPRWEPRFLCYSEALRINLAVLASAIAEGFLPAPRTRGKPQPIHPPTDAFALAVQGQEKAWLEAAVRRPQVDQRTRVRARKLQVLADAGMAAYPAAVPRTHTIASVRERHVGLEPDHFTGEPVSVAGRVLRLRDHGGISFATIRESGVDLQILVAADHAPVDAVRLWGRVVDVGDLVSCTGQVMTTRTGELSVAITGWTMAAKCLQQLMSVHGGQTAGVARRGQRHVELVVNPDARRMLDHRGATLKSIRGVLGDRGFLEVETPMLQGMHGGANARPFVTRSNAYHMDLYLRIAPELFLKRLCVGGVERIFELARNFRNEGADRTHNPEFTSLEVYQAFADYHDMRMLSRDLVLGAAVAVNGAPVARRGVGHDAMEVDLSGDWPLISVHDAVSSAVGVEVGSDASVDQLRALCCTHGVAAPAELTAGELVQELYEALVEPTTTTPTYYCDFPIEVSPLARPHRDDPRLAERWDLVAFGSELGTAYSELTDPLDQRDRLTVQSLKAAAGDADAMQVDEDFLAALSFGMAPTGGLGLGIDRLVMMLTGADIASTLAFPFVRPTRPGAQHAG